MTNPFVRAGRFLSSHIKWKRKRTYLILLGVIVLLSAMLCGFMIWRNSNSNKIVDGFVKGDLWGYKFTDKIDWNLPGITDPMAKYNFHGMLWLENLVDDWMVTHDDRYCARAISIAMSWVHTYHKIEKGQPEMVWNDDSTARRCYALCLMVENWGKMLTADQKKEIAESMEYHATLLADPDFYTWRQNHGIFQDRALLEYTLAFDNPKNKEYQALVKSRVMDYADNLILKDGVNAEHSPSYHVNIAAALEVICQDIRKIDPQYADNLQTNYIDKMVDYAIQITRPDGSYPQVGDSGTDFVPFSTWETNPQYLYVETKGKTGTMPTKPNSVFPYGGYALFRTDWTMNGTADWVMFLASTHGVSHKHHDDLSFLVWHHGDLFSDAGSAGYDYYGEPMALYAVEPWGHSVLVSNWDIYANSKAYKYRPAATEAALKTKITEYNIDNPQKVYVTGTQEKIPNVKQTRRLDWDKASGIITIHDTVTSTRNTNKYLFLFHLADDIRPEITDNMITLYRKDKKEATMSFASDQGCSVRLCYGDEDSTVKSWDAANKQPVYTIAVEYDDVPVSMDLISTITLLP